MLDANSDNYIRGEVQFAYNFKEVTDDQTEGGLVFGNITDLKAVHSKFMF